jgi:phosphoketolase
MTDIQERMTEPQRRTTLDRVDAWWRAANHIATGLPGGLRPEVAATTLTYAHLNRMIVRTNQRIRFVLGVRNAMTALAAVAQMEGARTPESATGGFALTGGHSYAVAYAVGITLDEPGLIAAVLVDEDETVAGWKIHALHDPSTDGAVLPILCRPTMDRDEVRAVFTERGWEPIEICAADAAADPAELHRCFAAALYVALDEIATRNAAAAAGELDSATRWPMLVLRTPAGWPSAEPVPADWLDADGRPSATIAQAAPSGDLRMSADG